MRLSKLAYEGMILSQKIIKKVNSQLILIIKLLDSKDKSSLCPKCNINILIPDTTICFDCFIKETKTPVQNQPIYNSTVC
jgi:hypothetical protein